MIPTLRRLRPLSPLPILILALGFLPLNSSLAGVGTELEVEIESYVKSLRRKGSVRGDERTAWVVYDITSNTKLASINENSSLQAASMIKPYVALAFFHQVRAGKLKYSPTSRKHMELMIQKSSRSWWR